MTSLHRVSQGKATWLVLKPDPLREWACRSGRGLHCGAASRTHLNTLPSGYGGRTLRATVCGLRFTTRLVPPSQRLYRGLLFRTTSFCIDAVFDQLRGVTHEEFP